MPPGRPGDPRLAGLAAAAAPAPPPAAPRCCCFWVNGLRPALLMAAEMMQRRTNIAVSSVADPPSRAVSTVAPVLPLWAESDAPRSTSSAHERCSPLDAASISGVSPVRDGVSGFAPSRSTTSSTAGPRHSATTPSSVCWGSLGSMSIFPPGTVDASEDLSYRTASSSAPALAMSAATEACVSQTALTSAQCRVVLPAKEGSAAVCAVSSDRTMAAWPREAASCRAALPLRFSASGSAPFASSQRTTPACSRLSSATQCRAVPAGPLACTDPSWAASQSSMGR
mmetsp:Transcript_26853/g.100868  ORF Transcript_26853/g.100868 Transcript_26853/m.100868 type:complete len:283 (+) Transcript_26853:1408-2256(+)